jgi:spermidine synthase
VVELDYVQRMLASLLWLPTEQLGRGWRCSWAWAPAPSRASRMNQLGMATTVVEINPLVIDACRLWFSLPDGPAPAGAARRRAATGCSRGRAGSVRLLHVDLYDHEAAAPVLDDEAFYAACRRVLAPAA